ncbi:hypothetical protein [endosymbiont GvMRE of Glomus versiforme]|uniref:hypothetical protein n=1 Tax=endosymbiont GvMRE of Glomus versiforme TaxID=2039283 RepID=UPI000ECA9FE8|nr:hypothetical protein [endosymbiont GvMRE of Glomus versiforme]RHZ37535.1 hypothetical protein GvMRE_I1g397 [endosymbiont GvMRE of Glomus versiforme]
MKQVEPKQTLSITIPITLYQRLQQEVGKGKISKFVKETVEKKLTEQENKLIQEYRECYANPRMIKEAKKWEKAEIESWRNYEKNKEERAKK